MGDLDFEPAHDLFYLLCILLIVAHLHSGSSRKRGVASRTNVEPYKLHQQGANNEARIGWSYHIARHDVAGITVDVPCSGYSPWGGQ